MISIIVHQVEPLSAYKTFSARHGSQFSQLRDPTSIADYMTGCGPVFFSVDPIDRPGGLSIR